MSLSELIGSWSLIKHGYENIKGEFQPTSSFLRGKIIYSPNGRMSVFIVKKETPDNLKDIIVYSGKYTLQQDQILHHIEVALTPERMNTTEVRCFEFIPPILRLSTIPTAEGRYVIEWKKE